MLTLNYRDSRPIYGQIKDGLRRMIVTGALGPDEKLPSVRSMAVDLAINPAGLRRAGGRRLYLLRARKGQLRRPADAVQFEPAVRAGPPAAGTGGGAALPGTDRR